MFENQAPANQEQAPVQQTEQASAREPSLLHEEYNSDLKVIEPGTKPDYIPDTAWDADKKEVKLDALTEEYKKVNERMEGLRTKLARGEGIPPKTEDGYKIPEIQDEKIKQLLDPQDPFVSKLRSSALKAGLTQSQWAEFLPHAAQALVELQGEVGNGQPLTPEQQAEQDKQWKESVYKELGENAPRTVASIDGWIRELHGKGMISESQAEIIKNMGGSANNIKGLAVLKSLFGGGESIPLDGMTNDGLPSDAEIGAMLGDPKYMSGDPSFHAKVNKLLEQRMAAGRPERLQF